MTARAEHLVADPDRQKIEDREFYAEHRAVEEVSADPLLAGTSSTAPDGPTQPERLAIFLAQLDAGHALLDELRMDRHRIAVRRLIGDLRNEPGWRA